MSLKFSIMITSVALAAILAGAWLADVYREHDSRAVLLPDQVITLFPDPKPLTAFALTDDKNRVFDLASLKGKWSFLFFGFTYCPDVCPTTLAVLARARKKPRQEYGRRRRSPVRLCLGRSKSRYRRQA